MGRCSRATFVHRIGMRMQSIIVFMPPTSGFLLREAHPLLRDDWQNLVGRGLQVCNCLRCSSIPRSNIRRVPNCAAACAV